MQEKKKRQDHGQFASRDEKGGKRCINNSPSNSKRDRGRKELQNPRYLPSHTDLAFLSTPPPPSSESEKQRRKPPRYGEKRSQAWIQVPGCEENIPRRGTKQSTRVSGFAVEKEKVFRRAEEARRREERTTRKLLESRESKRDSYLKHYFLQNAILFLILSE